MIPLSLIQHRFIGFIKAAFVINKANEKRLKVQFGTRLTIVPQGRLLLDRLVENLRGIHEESTKK